MRALLDVNILIALLDRDHTHHRRALEWFVDSADSGWASCPLTQNGCLRILSQASYPNPQAFDDVQARLRHFTSNAAHEFWPDDVCILDASRFDLAFSLGPRQLTDVYLLGLATARRARLVTFDQRVSLKAVRGATADHLLVI